MTLNPAFIVESVVFEILTLIALFGFLREWFRERFRARIVPSRMSSEAAQTNKQRQTPARSGDGKLDRLMRRLGVLGSLFLVCDWVDPRGVCKWLR